MASSGSRSRQASLATFKRTCWHKPPSLIWALVGAPEGAMLDRHWVDSRLPALPQVPRSDLAAYASGRASPIPRSQYSGNAVSISKKLKPLASTPAPHMATNE